MDNPPANPHTERLAPGLDAIVLPLAWTPWLAEEMPVRAYVLSASPEGDPRAPCVLIDAGYAVEESIEAIAHAVGERHVIAILLTHRHPDHEGGAMALAARFRAPVKASAVEASTLHANPQLVCEALNDGDRIAVGERTLSAIASPGHTRGHLCFHEERTGWLFTGDAVLGTGTVVVGPPDGDMVRYLATLERLRALRPLTQLLPGHGAPIDDPDPKLELLLRHRRMRIAQVRAALAKGTKTADDIVASLYAGTIPDHLLVLARISVLGTLALLVTDGDAVEENGVYRFARASAAGEPLRGSL